MARQLSMDLYLKHLKKQYVGADRKTKSHLLTELCRVGGYHRKYAIELLSGHMPKVNYGRRKRGKKKTYRPEGLMAPLKQIWFATDQMCGRRLKSVMPLWLPFYDSTYGTLNNDVVRTTK